MCTLKEIISELNQNPKLSDLKETLKKYNSDDWEKHKCFSERNYKKNLVFQNDNFEMFLVCWGPMQSTYIHDHSENGCIFKIIEGEISEHLYNEKLELIELNNLTEDSIGYIDNQMGLHRMTNESKKENCISLHIYSPPNFVATLFKA